MKKTYPKVDITIILDRSGSMAPLQSDTIGAYNKFLDDQKADKIPANLTLVQFDHEYGPVVTSTIDDAKPLNKETYLPRGSTALLDAIGSTIKETENRFKALPKTRKPKKVLFVIMTDGYENFSTKYNKDQIKDLIQSKGEWEFVFLGANVDAFAEANSMGIINSASYFATPQGLGSTLGTVSQNVSLYKSGTIASANSVSWDPNQK